MVFLFVVHYVLFCVAVAMESREIQEKTPVGILQESCSKRGLNPFYELVSEAPIFEYRVMVDDFFGNGRGRKKKFAKQAAAKALLTQVIEKGRHVQWNLPGGANKEEAQKRLDELLIVGEKEEDPEKNLQSENTIALLIDFCRKRRYPLPQFDEISVSEGVFGCTAVVGKLTEYATGRSKKSAKRASAIAILSTMQNSSKMEGFDEEDLTEFGSAYPKDLEKQLSCLKEAKGAIDSVQVEPVVAKHLSAFDLDNTPDENIVDLLAGLSREENGYEPTYYPMQYRSKQGMYQCLVQLPTTPVTVSFGEGKTRKDAQCMSARNSLKVLKVMEKHGSSTSCM